MVDWEAMTQVRNFMVQNQKLLPLSAKKLQSLMDPSWSTSKMSHLMDLLEASGDVVSDTVRYTSEKQKEHNRKYAEFGLRFSTKVRVYSLSPSLAIPHELFPLTAGHDEHQ